MGALLDTRLPQNDFLNMPKHNSLQRIASAELLQNMKYKTPGFFGLSSLACPEASVRYAQRETCRGHQTIELNASFHVERNLCHGTRASSEFVADRNRIALE